MDTRLLRKAAGILFCLFTAALLVWFAVNQLPIGRLFLGLGLVSPSPFDYPGTIWRSSDPVIELVISEEPDKYQAKMLIDGKMTPVEMVIDPSQGEVLIYRGAAISSNFILEGEIEKASDQKLQFSVTKDHCFSGKYDSITLLREPSG